MGFRLQLNAVATIAAKPNAIAADNTCVHWNVDSFLFQVIVAGYVHYLGQIVSCETLLVRIRLLCPAFASIVCQSDYDMI